MTTCLLVRHSHYERGDEYLAGRSDCTLSHIGRSHSEELAELLPMSVDAVQASPRRRCMETITPYVLRTNQDLAVCTALDEIDYGDWTGRSFGSLESDPSWRRWNDDRSDARPINGESMAEAQARILRHLRGLPASHDGTVIAVTHAELIRAVILHCRSLPLSAWRLVEVPLASIHRVEITSAGVALAKERAA